MATSTSPVLILDSSTALRTPIQNMSGMRITNCDTANSVYLGTFNGGTTLSTTKYWIQLAPGETLPPLDQCMGRGAAVQLGALSSAGTPSLHVEIIQ